MSRPVILSFNLSDSDILDLKGTAMKHGAEIRPVDISEYSLPIGVIASGICAYHQTGEKKTCAEIPEKMIVVSNFGIAAYNTFLHEIKEKHLVKGALKARICRKNIMWTPMKLYGELCYERQKYYSVKNMIN